MFTFLPYIKMPVRYIFAAIHIDPINVSTSKAMDVTSSGQGTPNGRRAIITTGDVSGNIENQKASELSGF